MLKTPLNLLKIKRHELEMMKDRNYKIIDKNDINILNIDMYKIDDTILNNFIKNYNIDIKQNYSNNKLHRTYEKIDEETGKSIYINIEYIFGTPNKILKKNLDTVMLKHIDKLNDDSIIYKVLLLLEIPLTSSLSDIYGNKNKLNIKHFLFENLLINPNKYMYTPKHILMKKEEVSEYLEKNNIDKTHLSKISTDDIIARWYDAKEGDVFKIERDFSFIPSIIQKSITYRCVVDTTYIRKIMSKSKNIKIEDEGVYN